MSLFFSAKILSLCLSNFSCSVFLGKFEAFYPKSLSMKKSGLCSCQKMQYLKRGIFRKTKQTPVYIEDSSCVHEGLGVV